jgi:hypothetical protein
MAAGQDRDRQGQIEAAGNKKQTGMMIGKQEDIDQVVSGSRLTIDNAA